MRSASLWLVLVWACSIVVAAETLPYQDPALPVEVRVEDLLARMTLEEKVGQMAQVNVQRLKAPGEWDRGPLNEAWLRKVFAELRVGAVLSGGGAAPVPNTPAAWAEMTNALQRSALEHSRLGIPLVYGVDAVHGHNNVLGATIYPHNVGLAATWAPELVEEVARRSAADVAATGIHWNFAPVADLGRDPRWGRFYETFGAEPWLAAEMVSASVRGFQSGGAVAATVKHFVGYGAAEDGRDRGPARISDEELFDLHLPAFEAGLAAGAAAVMANSGSVNGVPVHASAELLGGLLRQRLGFDGVVVSDWNDVERLHTVHGMAASHGDAVALAIDAGIDVVMVPHDAERFVRTLLGLVHRGIVAEERIDESVRRVLTLKMSLGLFERPYVDAGKAEAALAGDRELAFEAALRSLTLLENDGTLPLQGAQRVMVTGTSAARVAAQMGGWTIGWQGVERGDEIPPAVTVVEGMRNRAPAGTVVAYVDPVNRAVVREVARQADVVVLVLAEPPYAEGHGDTRTATLPADELDLLRSVLITGTPTVAVVFAGRPIMLPEEHLQGLAGLVMAYLPGSEGGSAVAEALFGFADFSGRLPFGWPRSIAPEPAAEAPGADEGTVPLRYPTGFGLSGARFEAGDPAAEVVGDALRVAVEVANVGALAGRETVTVFVEAHEGEPALQGRLVGFAQAALAPGETAIVDIEVPLARLATGPERMVLPGAYDLRVGDRRVRVQVP